MPCQVTVPSTPCGLIFHILIGTHLFLLCVFTIKRTLLPVPLESQNLGWGEAGRSRALWCLTLRACHWGPRGMVVRVHQKWLPALSLGHEWVMDI